MPRSCLGFHPFWHKEKNTAKGIDKWDPLPYNISREATDTVASPQIKEIIAFNLVGSGRLFLFIILKDKNDESQEIQDHDTEREQKFPSYVHTITSPRYETSGKASKYEKILSR